MIKINYMKIPIRIIIGGEIVTCTGEELERAFDSSILEILMGKNEKENNKA